MHTVDESKRNRPFLGSPRQPCQLHRQSMEMDQTARTGIYAWDPIHDSVEQGVIEVSDCAGVRTILISHEEHDQPVESVVSDGRDAA